MRVNTNPFREALDGLIPYAIISPVAFPSELFALLLHFAAGALCSALNAVTNYDAG